MDHIFVITLLLVYTWELLLLINKFDNLIFYFLDSEWSVGFIIMSFFFYTFLGQKSRPTFSCIIFMDQKLIIGCSWGCHFSNLSLVFLVIVNKFKNKLWLISCLTIRTIFVKIKIPENFEGITSFFLVLEKLDFFFFNTINCRKTHFLDLI